MSIIEILFLSAIQGLTEFIPVSSSGHLVLVTRLFGIETEETSFNTYILIMHFGTLFALIFYLRKKIWGYVKLLTGKNKKKVLETRNLLLKVAIGCMPIFIIGGGSYNFLKNLYNDTSNSSLIVFITSIMLIIVGILYLISEKIYIGKKFDINSLTKTKAFVIGIFQSFALIHGVSRSGITIFAGHSIGLKKADSIEFSFLMSIPVVGAASIFELINLIINHEVSTDLASEFILAFSASFIFGLLAINLLFWVLKVTGLKIFGVYCISIAILCLIFLT